MTERSPWAVIPVIIRKVRPSEVPELWQAVATGPWVYAAYEVGTETLLSVHATMREAKRKYSIWPQRSKEQQRIETYRRYHQFDPPKGKEGK